MGHVTVRGGVHQEQGRPGHYLRCKSWDHTHTAHVLSILVVSSLPSFPFHSITSYLMSCICSCGLVMFYCAISSGTWIAWTIAVMLIGERKPCNHIRQLEEAIHSCGVSFQVWQNREPSGKPIPGSFDFTPLSGKDKLKVLKKLPAKMDSILTEDLAPQFARLWNVCYNLYICSVLHVQVHIYVSRISTSFILLFRSSASPSQAEIDSFHKKVQCVNTTAHFLYTSDCKHQSVGKAVGE